MTKNLVLSSLRAVYSLHQAQHSSLCLLHFILKILLIKDLFLKKKKVLGKLLRKQSYLTNCLKVNQPLNLVGFYLKSLGNS